MCICLFQYCLNAGLILAEIKNSVQQASLANYFSTEYGGYENRLWMGLTDQTTEGTFLFDR